MSCSYYLLARTSADSRGLHGVGMLVIAVFVLGLVQRLSSQQDLVCPTLYGQLGDPQDLDLSAINVFLDPQQLNFISSRLYLVEDGTVAIFFDSLSTVTDPVVLDFILATLPNNLSSIPVQLTTGVAGPDVLYYSISLHSQREGIAPAACPSPHHGCLLRDTNQTIDVGLGCAGEGIAIQQLCLTVGTEPFSILNGTYHTFTFFFPYQCSVPRDTCAVPSLPPALIAQMCISPNQSLALVQLGAGSWSVLGNVLNPVSPTSNSGFCIISDVEGPPGIVSLLRDDSLNILYAIPPEFDDLEVYFATSRHLRSPQTLPLSYAILPYSENTDIVADPSQVLLQGVTFDGRVDFVFDLTCKTPGNTRVYVNFNVSTVFNGVLYSNTYPDLYFYRNCSIVSNDTILSVGDNLGVEVGVPLAVIFVVLVSMAVTGLVIMILFTRRYKKKAYQLEQERQLELLASSNAYMLSNFENALDGLRQLDIEYNYTSLEMVGELGEGAFGRVFKARAPGLEMGDEFVAVKTLKEDADSDILTAFVAEVETSARFKHPNVVRLVAICTEDFHKCMIFEYMDLGSLSDVLRSSDPTNPDPSSAKGSMTPDQFLSCCLQVAKGLTYLSSLKFVHRDIATRNCLVNSDFLVKIADFGLSRDVCADDYYRIGSAKACLPVRWMPPEALLYGKFTVKSDVWSYGVLMWEVYSFAQQPFGGISNYEVIDRIKEGRVMGCPELCPASIYDIMKSCWTRVPQKRPAMARILQRINHLLRSNSMTVLDDYTTMGSAEGYQNMNFGVVVGEEELTEKRRVDGLIKQAEEQLQNVQEGGGVVTGEGEQVGESEQEVSGEGDQVGESEQEVGGEGDQVGENEQEVGVEGDQVGGEGEECEGTNEEVTRSVPLLYDSANGEWILTTPPTLNGGLSAT